MNSDPSRISELAKAILPILLGVVLYFVLQSSRKTLANVETLVELCAGAILAVAIYAVLIEVTTHGLRSQVAALHTSLNSGAQTYFGEDGGLSEARKLQNSATKHIDTMWTLVPYDDALKKYFAETLAKSQLYTVRIVAARTVDRRYLLEHIMESWRYLADGKYELHLIPECDYEAMIADEARAGLFFYSNQGRGGFFLSNPNANTEHNGEFVAAIRRIFQANLQSPEARLVPVKEGDRADKDRIDVWLDQYYKDMESSQLRATPA